MKTNYRNSILLVLFSLTVCFGYSEEAFARDGGFLEVWMEDGKFHKLRYSHDQIHILAALEESTLMDKISTGSTYQGVSKDKLLTITLQPIYGSSRFSLDMKNITAMFHADSFSKDYKWKLLGPSIDSFYNLLAELANINGGSGVEKKAVADAQYSIGDGAVVCFIDRGGQGAPAKPPVKACLFAER